MELRGDENQSWKSNFLRTIADHWIVGVMRFLQMEWHNHERARNAWDIERAEMKQKISKLEGDSRSAKKLNDILGKNVRMLEKALRDERAKNKALAGSEKPPAEDESKQGPKGKGLMRPELTSGMYTARHRTCGIILARR